jgi:hypothetical protein
MANNEVEQRQDESSGQMRSSAAQAIENDGDHLSDKQLLGEHHKRMPLSCFISSVFQLLGLVCPRMRTDALDVHH